MSKHVHEFYPTGEKVPENRTVFADSSEIVSSNYLYKFICECGKVKWVKEK